MTKFNEYNDEDLFNLFSDWYKDVNGVRPGRRTREDILSWMAAESDPAVEEQRRVEWDRETAWLDELEFRANKDRREWLETSSDNQYDEYDYMEEVL